VAGGARLVPLRVPDPAGGLPWGMRVIHTTRGLICVQIGRVHAGQLGQLGVDGAFHDDDRFHPLPVDALPDVLASGGWMAGNCSSPGDIYAGDSVGLPLSASSSHGQRGAPRADLREVSFGLLGAHAVSVSYREGPHARTQAVLPGLGAYLIVQRYSSGRPLGSVSETDGRDEPGNYSRPAGPNGALTAITYSYAGRSCVDRGHLRLASCGLSEVPPPHPATLPILRAPLHAQLHIHKHVITAAEIRFRAPYPVTNADESYSVSVPGCHGGLSGSGSDSDIPRGGLVVIPVGRVLSQACRGAVRFTVEYVRFVGALPKSTPIGTITIHEPPGTRPTPLPQRVAEQERRSNPTRSLRAPVRLMLLPQPRAACNAAFLRYPCFKGQVIFTAPYAAAAPTAEYSIEGYARCKSGGRPETRWNIGRHVSLHETISTTSLGLFVVTPSCAPNEGFRVAYLNQHGLSASAPHGSVIVGTVPLSNAALSNGSTSKASTR